MRFILFTLYSIMFFLFLFFVTGMQYGVFRREPRCGQGKNRGGCELGTLTRPSSANPQLSDLSDTKAYEELHIFKFRHNVFFIAQVWRYVLDPDDGPLQPDDGALPAGGGRLPAPWPLPRLLLSSGLRRGLWSPAPREDSSWTPQGARKVHGPNCRWVEIMY